jgi:transcriptional regulator with XRE-family HTH domain
VDDIGEHLRAWRYKRGLNQIDLAALSGIGQDTISGLESGKHVPRARTLKKLSDALEVSVEELIDGPKAQAPALA